MKCDYCGELILYKYCFSNKSRTKIMCKCCMEKKYTSEMADKDGKVVGTIIRMPNFGQDMINRAYLRKHKTKCAIILLPDNMFNDKEKSEGKE